MIIDIRCRYLTREAANYFPSSINLETHESPDSFFSWLDQCGVDVVLSPTPASLGLKLGRFDLPARSVNNDQQAELQREFPERFVGVAGIDPGNVIHDGLQELERCVNQLGLRVAAIEPGRNPLLAPNPADPRLYDFYSLAQELGVPVIIQTSGPKGGVNIDYAHPRWIDQIAHDFPHLNIICAHGCVPYFEELAVVTQRRPNVYASPDCYTFRNFSACKRFHPGQLIFASSYPSFGNIEPMIQDYLSASWGQMKLDDIMYRNAIRALKLDHNPFFADKLEMPEVFRVKAQSGSNLGIQRNSALTKIAQSLMNKVRVR